MAHFPILIIGAGIGGLTCALALQQHGLRPIVLEQAQQLGEVGAGLQLSPNAMSVMRQLGLETALQAVGFLPKGIQSNHWRTGQVLTQVPFAPLDFHAPYLHIHRADLHQILRDTVRANDPDCIRTSQQVTQINCDHTQLTLDSGAVLSADWIIGADGIRSVCRDAVLGQPQPARFTGNVAWRGVLRRDAVPAHLHPAPYANLWMGAGGHVVAYYLRGGELINFIAVREQDDWQDESWQSPAHLAVLLGEFAGWDSKLLDLMAHSDPKQCYRWALFDRDPISTWSKHRTLLLGDAAHPMLPFLAQGAAMAMEDSWVLSQLIAQTRTNRLDPDQVGTRYQTLRAERCARVQQLARDNMQLFHHRLPFMRFGRDLVARGMNAVSPHLATKRVAWIYDWQAMPIAAD
ncbi:MAG: FAD-dependent monooxygenase [Pseudomonadota bacterium]|nr:FAD-dependent monooxygenase [Pseudomonadota bacterium]